MVWTAGLPVAATVNSPDDASYLTRLEQASVVASLANLKTFPFIRTPHEGGALALHGAYFNVASGELSVLDQASGQFVAVG